MPSILKKTDSAIVAAEKELANIFKISRDTKRTLANTLEPWNRVAIILAEVRSQSSLLSAVHPDKKMRDDADKATQKISAIYSKFYLRPDIYQAIKSVSPEELGVEARRFREKELLDFKLSGIEKSSAVRAEIKRLIKRSVKLGQDFDRNIKDDIRYVLHKPEDLAGLPEDYIKAHPIDRNGNIKITTTYPDHFPLMKYAMKDETRKKHSFEFLNRGWPKNDKIFLELLRIRQKLAVLIGYRNWADYVTADKMAQSSKTVNNFLEKVAALAESRARKDYDVLLAQRQKDDPKATEINSWQYGYYENLVLKEKVGFDAQAARKYFPFLKAKDGVLKMTAKLFGLSYHRVKKATWHKDVEVYDVFRGKKCIGRFYLDLHSREGKFSHAACFDVQQGIHEKQLPEAALICNFSRGLMEHDEVVTFFHEFGHLIHFILAGDQKWIRFSGTATEWDFVEAPSQMLEAWAWDYETLRQFARDEKSKKSIDKKLVTQMRKADRFGRGIGLRQQVFYAMLSLRYHTEKFSKSSDLIELVKREQKKYHLFRFFPGTHFYANFGHLKDYSAMYYTYLWSRSIAQDLFSRFEKEGMYGARATRDYVNFILAPGGTKDAEVLVRNFLGRQWNLKAFERWINES
jgi:thimet oligopeptidase